MTRVALDAGEAGDVPVAAAAPLHELAGPPAVPALSPPEFADWVDFFAAGSNASGEFRCADCGYGAVVQTVLPPCPMCRGSVWERRESRLAR